jgi:hypothetical protein
VNGICRGFDVAWNPVLLFMDFREFLYLVSGFQNCAFSDFYLNSNSQSYFFFSFLEVIFNIADYIAPNDGITITIFWNMTPCTLEKHTRTCIHQSLLTTSDLRRQ